MTSTFVYRVLLHLLPRRRRERFGHEMALVFADKRQAARRDAGALGVGVLWMKETGGIVKFGLRERLSKLGLGRSDSRAPRSSGRLPNELRWAWRGVRARGGRTALIVALLGVALAANTLLFSIADSLVFRTLPFRDADRLVTFKVIYPTGGSSEWALPANALDGWRQQTHVFAGLHGFLSGELTFVLGNDQPELVRTTFVTPGLIEMLGWTTSWGRTLVNGDELETDARVVVIGEELARQRFGSAAHAVGGHLATTSGDLVVVGVVPAGFAFPEARYMIWRPLDYRHLGPASRDSVSAVARLAPGVTTTSLTTWLQVASASLAKQPAVAPTPAPLLGGFDRPDHTLVLMLVGAGLCLLVIACANVVSLEFSTALARARTYAIRMALGASRAGIVRTAAIEGALVVGASVILALALIWLGAGVVKAWLPDSLIMASANPIDIDTRALIYMSLVATCAWAAASMPIALFGSRQNLNDLIKTEGRTAAVSRGGARVRQGLTMAEVALAVLLLMGGALFGRSYVALLNIDKGFDTSGLVRINLTFPGDNSNTSATTTEVLTRLRARPDVKALSTVGSSVLDAQYPTAAQIEVDGAAAQSTPTSLVMRTVDAAFFDVLQMPPKRGRLLVAGDPKDQVVISERLASRLWPGADAIGHQFRVKPGDPWNTVIGLVGNTRNISDPPTGPNPAYERFAVYSLMQPRAPRPAAPPAPITTATPPAAVVAPPAQPRPNVPNGVLFRSYGYTLRLDPPNHIGDVVRDLRAIDRRFELTVESLDETYAKPFQDRLLASRIVGAFAVIAFLVAMAGVYGVMSFLVAGRTREVGIRVALGADRRDIRRLILGASLRMVIFGAGVGVAGALAASRWLQSQLFGVSSTDPLTYVVVVSVVIATAIGATWQPAREAARVDPAITLRAE